MLHFYIVSIILDALIGGKSNPPSAATHNPRSSETAHIEMLLEVVRVPCIVMRPIIKEGKSMAQLSL